MKKLIGLFICIFTLSLLLLAGNAAAYNAAFTHTDYMGSAMPTLDGKYTTNAEYSAGASLGFGTDGVFRDFWASSGNVFENFIIETMDTTNDQTDTYTICYDSNADGGSTPKTDDFKIVITGHGTSATVAWFKGTGTAWATATTPSATISDFKESLATSPTSSTPHYMVEVKIDKQDTTAFGASIIGMNFAMRIAYTDASTGTTQAWPPTPATADSPDSWGYVPYSMDAVPESLSIAVILALSSFAVVAGAVLIRKPKTLALNFSR
jgi:hypothetical protein